MLPVPKVGYAKASLLTLKAGQNPLCGERDTPPVWAADKPDTIGPMVLNRGLAIHAARAAFDAASDFRALHHAAFTLFEPLMILPVARFTSSPTRATAGPPLPPRLTVSAVIVAVSAVTVIVSQSISTEGASIRIA